MAHSNSFNSPECRDLILFKHRQTTSTLRLPKYSYPKASFLGIPIELRLQIYAYLLSPPPNLLDPLLASSLCMIDHYDEECWKSHHYFCSCHCDCRDLHGAGTRRARYPQILRTCHQVLREAVDILYADFEYYLIDFQDGLCVQAHFPALPVCANHRVKSVTLVGSATDHILRLVHSFRTVAQLIELWCRHVAGSFPNLERIFLQLDHRFVEFNGKEALMAGSALFEALAPLAGVRALVQVHTRLIQVAPESAWKQTVAEADALVEIVRRAVPDGVRVQSSCGHRAPWHWKVQYYLVERLTSTRYRNLPEL